MGELGPTKSCLVVCVREPDINLNLFATNFPLISSKESLPKMVVTNALAQTLGFQGSILPELWEVTFVWHY